MEVTEIAPSLAKSRLWLTGIFFSKEQKWIVYSIDEEKFTWWKIIAVCKDVKNATLSYDAIVTCLLRSSTWRPWKKREYRGNTSYLGRQELEMRFVKEPTLVKLLTQFQFLTKQQKSKQKGFQNHPCFIN